MEVLSVPLAGDFENFFADNIWPHRWIFAIAAIGALIVFVAVAYRFGWQKWAWQNRLFTGPALAIFLIISIPLGYYLVSPLWQRSTVCEVSPIAGAGSGSEKCDDGDAALAATNPPTDAPTDAPADATDAPVATDEPTATDEPSSGDFEAQVVDQGTFQGADDFHYGNGTALLIQTAPDAYVLRFEDFSVLNGPDLFVVLSPSADGYADGSLVLGELKGTDGAFNYDVPAGTDLSQYASAVVWCRQFNVTFATATFGS